MRKTFFTYIVPVTQLNKCRQPLGVGWSKLLQLTDELSHMYTHMLTTYQYNNARQLSSTNDNFSSIIIYVCGIKAYVCVSHMREFIRELADSAVDRAFASGTLLPGSVPCLVMPKEEAVSSLTVQH